MREEEKKRKAEEEAARAAAEAEQAQAAAKQEEEQRRAAEEERARKDEERRARKAKQQAEEEERQRQEAMMAAEAAPPPPPPGAGEEEAQEQQMPYPSPPGSAGGAGGEGLPGPPPDADMVRQGPPGSIERPRTAGRRPPKVSSKVTTAKETPTVAPAVVLTEGTKDDDDDDMFEQPEGAPGGPALKVATGDQHGKLVQDLLAQKKQEEERERLRKEEEQTREEVDDGQSKGIVMGKLKKKKTQASAIGEIDIAKLGEMIQALCQAANPLGKSIDLVHQDIANMGKELDKWKAQYAEATEQYQRELMQTESQLQPLYQKVAELDDLLQDQRVKIRNSRSRIAENDV